MRGSGARLQIFGRAAPAGRRRVPGDRTDNPSLDHAATSLRRRCRGIGGLPAGAGVECRARLGLVAVPRGAGRRVAPPLRAPDGDRRASRVSPALDMVAAGVVRLCCGAPRAVRPGTLVAVLPRSAANSAVHGSRTVEEYALSLGSTGLSDFS